MYNLLAVIRENRWYEDFVSFRSDPRGYFIRKKIADDEFLLDVLQVLFEDSVSEQCKLELLNALQESDLLFQSLSSVENTIGSLQNLYSQVMSDRHVAAHGLLPGQILNTMVSVLLVHADDVIEKPMYGDLYQQLIDLLWTQCCKVNATTKYLVRCAAIQGLLEIENTFPGILASKLEELKNFCQQEKTFMLQYYTTMLTVILKNSFSQENIQNNSLLLHKHVKLDPSANVIDAYSARKYLTFIIDLFPYMLPVSIIYSLQNLLGVVMQLNDVSPLVFKPIYLRYMMTNNAVAFTSVIFLQKKFGHLISSEEETKQLVSQLLIQINHPALTIAQRLLALSWCLENIDVLKVFASDKLKKYFLCNGFDGAETQHMNQKLLSVILMTGLSPDESSKMIVSSLNLFRKKLVYGYQSKIVVATFRSLYWFYCHHCNTVIKPEIQKIVLSLIADKPKLAHHVLDFVQVIKSFDSESSLPVELVSALVNNITKLKVTDVTCDDLHHHLVILEFASKESLVVAQPMLIIKFLHKLLVQTDLCETGGWFLGNIILAVCRSILYYQNTDNVYEELGDLLHKISVDFMSDTDVRDQAKLYYAMHTSISSAKLSSMMQGIVRDNDNELHFEAIVSDGSGLRMGIPVMHLDNPVLEVKKVSRDRKPFVPEVRSEYSSNTETDISEAYFKHMDSPNFNPEIRIEYSLSIIAGLPKQFDILFGLVLSFEVPDDCEHHDDLEIPALLKCDGPKYGHVTLHPSKPGPMKIKLKATFNQQNGQTCSCKLPDLDVHFEDSFQPLSMPNLIRNLSSSKYKLFKELESLFMERAKLGQETECQRCVFRLPVTKDELIKYVIPTFQPYMIPSTTEHQYHAAMFVLPRGHLLCSFSPNFEDGDQSQTILLSMLTDSWPLFGHVDAMLARLVSKK